MKQNRFLISGGGTGGHIYPAISIAEELSTKFDNNKILFVGSCDRMEMQKVPENSSDLAKEYGVSHAAEIQGWWLKLRNVY